MILRTLLAAAAFAALCIPAPGALSQSRDADADQANPVAYPRAPWHFDGFSLTIPEGEDWASFSKSPTAAELGKKFDDGRTAAVVIEQTQFDESVVREQDLLRLAKRLHAVPPEPESMKVTRYDQEAVSPKGVLCVRSVARFDDRRPQYQAPGTLVVRSQSCIRPDKPEMLVSLRFAERYAGSGEPALAEQADRFLSSLRFIPPGTAMISQARGAIANQRTQDALDLLKPAAELDDLDALLFLGSMYLYGSGVQADPALARGYYERAAKWGHRDALFNLGAIYDKAIGVQRDPAEAMKWFGRAADQRDPSAQLNLALFHLKGDGVPKDEVVAEQWLRRAAANGSTRAKGMLTLLKERQGR
jgi:hypothetical protein